MESAHNGTALAPLDPDRVAEVARGMNQPTADDARPATDFAGVKSGSPSDRFKVVSDNWFTSRNGLKVGDEVTRREVERVFTSSVWRLVFGRTLEPIGDDIPEQSPPPVADVIGALWDDAGADSDAFLARLVEIGTDQSGDPDVILRRAPETKAPGDAGVASVALYFGKLAKTGDAPPFAPSDSAIIAAATDHRPGTGPALDGWLADLLDRISDAAPDDVVALLRSPRADRRAKGLALATPHVAADFGVWREVSRLAAGGDEIADVAARLLFDQVVTARPAPKRPRKGD